MTRETGPQLGDTHGSSDLVPPAPSPPGEVSLRRRFLQWLVPSLTVFIASFCIMVLELVAGRMIAPSVGVSLYTWTSVIGIVLAGITLGNFLGGFLADWFQPKSVLSILFLLASGLCILVPPMNEWAGSWDWDTPDDANWLVGALATTVEATETEDAKIFVSWPSHIFGHVLVVFLLPPTVLGMISPVAAKMALDTGHRVGRTVGNVYAWGALGSIAGTFAAGFYLIYKMNTGGVLFSIALVLAVVGILFCLSLLWGVSRPRDALVSFFCVSWVLLVPPLAFLYVLVDWKILDHQPWPWEWVSRDGHTVLRPKADPENDIYYVDESNYSFIKVEGEYDSDKEVMIRELVLDNLIHSYYIPGQITELHYEYELIYKALTHRHVPPDADQEGKMAALFIGGGGYIYPRYLRAFWPCYIEVAEIDPAVTQAVLAEFGLREDEIQIVKPGSVLEREGNPMWVYHLDARNHVEDLIRKRERGEEVPKFDFVYGDAFNDYAVPFHLTTVEYTEKIKVLLKPGTGIYMINVIDMFKPGKFLGAIYNTFVKVFGKDKVYVFTSTDGEPAEDRDTYVVVGALRSLDLDGLPGEEEPYIFEGILLTKAHLRELTEKERAGDFILTDEHAPVENLLMEVVRER